MLQKVMPTTAKSLEFLFPSVCGTLAAQEPLLTSRVMPGFLGYWVRLLSQPS